MTDKPRTVTNQAPPLGMTLDDLLRFCEDCAEARLNPDTVVRVLSTMTGRILQIQATDGQR